MSCVWVDNAAEFQSFRSDIIDSSIFLAYDVASMGNRFQAFRDNVVASHSGCRNVEHFDLEDEAAMFARNVGNQTPKYTASYHRRTEFSANAIVSKTTTAFMFTLDHLSSKRCYLLTKFEGVTS